MKILKTSLLLALSAFVLSISQSCIDKDISDIDTEKPQEEEFFDFSMKSGFTLDLDYGIGKHISNGSYQVIFELYTEEPFVYDENGNYSKKENTYPIYSAWTDGDGKYHKENVILPSSIKEVYLVSSFIGASRVVRLDVVNGEIFFNQDEYQALDTKSSLRAANNWKLPASNWETLGNWTKDGYPDYLMGKRTFDAQFIEEVNAIFLSSDKTGNKKDDIWYRHPEYFYAQKGTKTDMDVHITKDTEVTLSLIKCDAFYKSAFGYYVYETAKRPKAKNQIKSYYVVFSHLSKDSKVTLGDQVKLKFPGEDGLTDVFPAGYSIGFFLLNGGFNNGNLTNSGTYFSDTNLNIADKDVAGQRSVALFDSETKQMIAIGFEDAPEIDRDYDDALLSLYLSVPDAIDTSEMPELPPVEKEPDAESHYSGLLLFEDLWPSTGDYDMNDVVIKYNSVVYRDKSNSITKIEDRFTPVWNGAYYANGFGYQLPSVLPNSHVKAVTTNSVSEYMNGGKSESGQRYQTIMLYDNNATSIGQEYKVTIEFVEGAVKDLVPPYNPFIFTNGSRSSEVHLVNHFPTDLADTKKLGEGQDKSDPDKGIYYVATGLYPFAMDIPKIDFKIVKETQKISNAYGKYSTWVESNGQKEKDWYNYPNADYVEE